MAIACFYLLDESHQNPLDKMIEKTCQLSAFFSCQKMTVYIAASDKIQAEQIDEVLWQRSALEFVPHNLVGEGPRNGAVVEIGWPQVHCLGRRNVLINLTSDTRAFAPTFAQVIDFVPCDDERKQQARERYKIYRMARYQMRSLAIDDN